MAYLKVQVTLKGVTKRVYRDFYVDEDILLEEFGVKVLSTFNVMFEHYFLFSCGIKRQFAVQSWVDDTPDLYEGTYKGMKLVEMPVDSKNCFEIAYDTGENYEFKVQFLGDRVDKINSDENMICVNGRGEGIFENDSYLLYWFLKLNSMKAAIKYVSEDDYYSIPYNTDMDDESTTKDYFKPLDFEYLNEEMYSSYEHYKSDPERFV